MKPVGERRSRTALYWILGCAIALTGASFYIGSGLKSPAEAGLPSPTPLAASYADVELRRVDSRPILQGTVSGKESMTVPAWVPDGTTRAVVTDSAVHNGDQVASGSRLLGISGRPLIALDLEIPLYRNLHLGDSGPDVRALQSALVDLDLLSRRNRDRLDDDTAKAIRALYARADATAPGADSATSSPDATSGPDAPTGPVALPLVVEMHELVAVSSGWTVTGIAGVGTTVETGQPVLTLVRGTPTVLATANAAQVRSFARDQEVDVRAPGTADPPERGVISEVSELVATPVDNGENSIPVHHLTIVLPGDSTFASGVEVNITAVGEVEQSMAIPVGALRQTATGSYVYVKTGESADRKVPVTVLDSQDGWLAIAVAEGDLKAGDKVRLVP